MSKTWLGFDGRMFLTDEEHKTYLRRPPVRYAAKGLKPHNGACEICGETFTEENPAQASHKIPFLKGVLEYHLTPEWLDRSENLLWAHKKKCNAQVEWDSPKIIEYIHSAENPCNAITSSVITNDN